MPPSVQPPWLHAQASRVVGRCGFLALVAVAHLRFAAPDLISDGVYTHPTSVDTTMLENPNFALGLAGSPGGNRTSVNRERAGVLIKRTPLTDLDPEARRERSCFILPPAGCRPPTATLPPAFPSSAITRPRSPRPPQATCNDGTSAYYYFRKGWGNQWLVYLEVRFCFVFAGNNAQRCCHLPSRWPSVTGDAR